MAAAGSQILTNGNVNVGAALAVGGNVTSTGGQFNGNGAGLTNIPFSALTNASLGFLSFQTNAGVVTFIDLPVSGAAAGTAESYSLQIAGTNALTFIGNSDGTTITNPVVAFNIPFTFSTNAQATWPKVPPAGGGFAIVSSNGYPYMLLSTNLGVGSNVWTGTNKLGW